MGEMRIVNGYGNELEALVKDLAQERGMSLDYKPGDTRLTWDAGSEDDVDNARATFERLREAREVEERARALLLSCLTPAQREEYERTRNFTVTARSGNRYRIKGSSRAYNVALLNGDKETNYLCAAPIDDLPLPDQMLAQKCALEGDEAGFLKIANYRPNWQNNSMTVTIGVEGSAVIRGRFISWRNSEGMG